MKEFLKNKVQVIITSILAVILLTLSIVGGITISNLNNQINDLNNQIENMNKVDEDLDSYIKTIETELNTIKTNLNSTNTKINELEVAFGTDLEEAEENILKELNNVKTSLESELEEISTLIEELTNKDSTLESRISSLEFSVNNLNTTLEALTIQVEKNAEDIKALEDIIAGLEIRINCLEGNHVADTTKEITYTWSEDYNEATADGYCVHCEKELHETVTTTYLDGVVSADFTAEYFEDQSVVLTDTLNMTADELKRSLMKLVSEGETDIEVELQKDASEEIFTAIREGLVNANDGTINLTLSGVETIFERAFYESLSLKSISLPNVITVGDHAFYYCENLKKVDLPLAETIGTDAFANCYTLTLINIPEVITIGDYAFGYCDLSEINLPKVTSIGDDAFWGTYYITKVTFGMPLTEIGRYIFSYRHDTTGVDLVFAKGQKNFTGDNTNGWTITEEDIPTGNNVEFLGYTFKSITVVENIDATEMSYYELEELLLNTSSTNIHIKLPKDFEDFDNIKFGLNNAEDGTINLILSGVENILDNAFHDTSKLKSISLPDATYIGEAAFMNCDNLESIDAASVTTIGLYAFDGCDNLKVVDAPNVITIGESAFYNCENLHTINIPSAETIGYFALRYTAITELNLPSVTSVGEYVFVGCDNLTKVIFGTPVTYFSMHAFPSDTTKIDLVFASGQKDFLPDGTITEEDVPTGENVEFLGYTFKSITIAE